MAKNSQIQKQLEAKGWKFKVAIQSGRVHGEKGSRKLVGTSWTDLFRKIRGY